MTNPFKPLPHKCNKCGAIEEFSYMHPLKDMIFTSQGDVICNRCWEEFVIKHCGVLKILDKKGKQNDE